MRSANTGVSGIVDPCGHVLARTDIFHSAMVVGDASAQSDDDLHAHRRFAYLGVVTPRSS